MSTSDLHIVTENATLTDLMKGPIGEALGEVSGLVDAALTVRENHQDDGTTPENIESIPILYHKQRIGDVCYSKDKEHAGLSRAAKTIGQLSAHMVDRELAIGDLATAMMDSYEELDMLYGLLPAVATKSQPEEIGEVLVEETSRLLRCRRVSLLVLDEKRENFTVVASRGLPEQLRGIELPLKGSVASQALSDEDFLIVNSMDDRPDLSGMSRGEIGRAHV